MSELITPPPFRANSSTTIVPGISSYNTLNFGGGMTLYGGTSSSNGVDFYTNSATWDSNNTGRLTIHDRINLTIDDGDVTLTNVPVPPFFTAAGVTFITIPANVTIRTNGTNAASAIGFQALQTLTYNTTGLTAFAPTFQAANTVRDEATVTTTDAVTFFPGFSSDLKYRSSKSTAISKTVPYLLGYTASPEVGMVAGSHASATLTISNFVAYGAFSAQLSNTILDSQTTVTNMTGFEMLQPLNAGGGVITNQRGVTIAALSAGTNNVGLLLGTTTSPSGNWALYSASSNASYYAGEVEIDGAINHDGTTIGFFGVTPATRQTELTDELTTITFTSPGTPDYAIAAPVDSSGGAAFGFSTADEFNTVMSVIANLQTRNNEMETKLAAYGLLQDAD